MFVDSNVFIDAVELVNAATIARRGMKFASCSPDRAGATYEGATAFYDMPT